MEEYDSNDLNGLFGNIGEKFIEVKTLLSGSCLNIMEMNNNVYLKRVRKTYKKHERNTKGKIGVKK